MLNSASGNLLEECQRSPSSLTSTITCAESGMARTDQRILPFSTTLAFLFSEKIGQLLLREGEDLAVPNYVDVSTPVW